MGNLEERLEALLRRGDLQDMGVVDPTQRNGTQLPTIHKAPTLHTFDGIGSPNQHIYYFKSQTGNVVLNDAIMVHLFIGILKRVAFEWFMKLPAGSIKTWANLEKLFLSLIHI